MSFYKDKLLYYDSNKNNYKFKKYLNKTNQNGGFYNKKIPADLIDRFDKLYLTAFHGEISDKEFILDDKTFLLIPFADGCVNYYQNAFEFTGIKKDRSELTINNEPISHFTNVNQLIALINQNIKVNKLVDINGTKYQLLHPGDTTCNLKLTSEYNISGMIMGTFNPFYDYRPEFIKSKNNFLNIESIKKAIVIMHTNGIDNVKCDLLSLFALLRLDNHSDAKILRTIENIINAFFKYIICSIKKEAHCDISNLDKLIFAGIDNFFIYIFSKNPTVISNNDTFIPQFPSTYIKRNLKNNFNELFSLVGIFKINTGSDAKQDIRKDKEEDKEVFDDPSVLDGDKEEEFDDPSVLGNYADKEEFDDPSVLDGDKEEEFDDPSVLDGDKEEFDDPSLLDGDKEEFDDPSVLDFGNTLSIDEIITRKETYKIVNKELYSKYKKLIKHQIVSLLFLTVITFYDIDKIYNLKSHKTLYDLLNYISVNTPIDKKSLIINISCRVERELSYSKISKCISYSCITPKIINLITAFNEKNNLLLSEVPDNRYIISGILSTSVFIENIFTLELNYKKLIEETIKYIDLLDIPFRGTIIISPNIRKKFNEAIKEICGEYIDDKYVNIIIESSKNYSNYTMYEKNILNLIPQIVNFIKIVIKHVLFNLIHSTMKDELIINNYDYLNNLIETKYPILKNNDIIAFINKINETNPVLAKELLVLYFNVFIKANNKMINRFSK